MVGFKVASILPLLGSAFGGVIQARQNPTTQDLNTPWPISYIALGDSFAAGIGAGHYVSVAADDDTGELEEVRRCKRFDNSYPEHTKLIFPHVDNDHFGSKACSGDVLSGIEAQLGKLGGSKAHLITLSISGNDFKFGNVVENCIYNYVVGDGNKDIQCRNALNEASAEIGKDSVWQSYTDKVNNILAQASFPDLLNHKWTVLVITGYAKFFAEPAANDDCSSKRFPIPAPFIKGNLLRQDVRASMNILVDQVNQNIQQKIVNANPDRIRFVNIDDNFRGHRFCEPGATDPIGGNDDNVWFISFDTPLLESTFVPDGNSVIEQSQWNQGLAQAAGLQDGDDLLPTSLQKIAVFHPKAPAHAETAKRIKEVVDQWGADNGHNQTPPPPTCVPSNAHDIPDHIIAVSGQNLNGSPEIVDPNGLLYKLRDTLCNSNCKIPDGMDTAAGAIVSDDSGRCEISLGVQGGSEAYALRDRATSGDKQVQLCWDNLADLIDRCVQNGANEGWRGGVDPNPAFYQIGYRALNSGKHDAIPEDHLLQKDLTGFQSICGAGDGGCQDNGCEGVSYICQAGYYKGCYCGSDSRFGTLPGPDHTLQCHTDCCSTTPSQWFLPDWCNANCGGISSQFC